MRDRRLLFLSQTLPYPPDSGVKSRTYNVLRQLAGSFDIHALCFHRRKGSDKGMALDGRLAGLRPLAQVEAFPILQEGSRVRTAVDHLKSLLSHRSYVHYVYESSAFRSRLRALLRDRGFALVHADSLDLAGYLGEVEGLPVVCVHHDVQSVLLARRADRAASAGMRAYLRHQARLMAADERRWLGKVALNVAVSPLDRAEYLRRVPQARVEVVPNGVDVEYFRARARGDDGLVFVGGADWHPNRDAMLYFGTAILPRIRAGAPRVKARWVGWVDDETGRAVRDMGIEVVGHVPDIRPYLENAACYVVPLRIGGGTRIKILDAWAMGMPVVSTPLGCEGLEAVEGDNILVGAEPASFAHAVVSVLKDSSLRDRLGRNARGTAERLYSWDAIGADMVALYRSLL